ncbi:MAG: cysteine synthase family protein [candidate division Zixibacteria bacterium]|nr:cysteine synthase family protein [candidate division Zixibacteria bacterium]
MRYDDVLSMIGNTALLDLAKVFPGFGGKVFGKAEYLNPGGSLKDRTALRIIQSANNSGELKPGMPIVESTSGNMGAGLALVARQLGYRFIAVMSEGNSWERRQIMSAFGAEVVLTPQNPGGEPGRVTGADWELVEERTRELAKKLSAYYPNQFENPEGIRAHYFGTGAEIHQQAAGKVTCFGATIGTGGIFMGVTRYLKEMNPNVKSFVIEPVGCAPLSGQKMIRHDHIIQGTSYSRIPQKWEPSLADVFVQVSDDEVLDMTRRLARDAGYLVGFSSGANVAGIAKMIELGEIDERDTVVTILCDTGMKYLSSGLLGVEGSVEESLRQVTEVK